MNDRYKRLKQEGLCTWCGKEPNINGYYCEKCENKRKDAALKNKEHRSKVNKQWRIENKGHLQKYIRNKRLISSYGITYEDKMAMLETQKYRCAICSESINDSSPLDHNHETGEVREILCFRCNQGIGHAREDIKILESMILYLIKHNY